MFKRLLFISSLLITMLGLSSCGTDAGSGTISTVAPMEANFSPADSVIPFPYNILFKNSTTGLVDGTLQVPGTTNPVTSMNTLNGFSTVAPITTTFSMPIAPASITATSVRVFEVVDATIATLHAAGGFTRELTFGTEFVALPSPGDAKTLVIKPVIALKSNTNYMVVVSNGLKSTSGQAAVPSGVFRLLKSPTALVDGGGVSLVPGVDDATAASLEGLRQFTAPLLAIAGALGTPADTVAITWAFKTQTLGAVLAAVKAASAATMANPADFGVGAIATADAIFGSVVTGKVNLPYYLNAPAIPNNPQALEPLSGSFNVNPATSLPVLKSTQIIPFVLTIPKAVAPVNGWPVVIFQHGFEVDKSVMFGIANALATAGFATIAIDSVLHGDRTFALDLIDNVTGAPGPDGTADPSGAHYMNLASLLTARDNIRQSVIDLIHLTRLLEIQTMDVVNNTTGAPGVDAARDLDVANIRFVGHSNGAILGTMLAALEPVAISRAVLANPGGDYTSILQNSTNLSPRVNAGLAAQGLLPGTANYNSYFIAAQTVVDDGDPINYAAAAAARPIFLLKTTPDDVVPNAQTDNLSVNLGLPQISGNGAVGWPLGVLAPPQAVNGFVNYTAGTHSSFRFLPPLSPETTAMQADSILFLQTGMINTSDLAVTE